jgi:hypothetical protein
VSGEIIIEHPTRGTLRPDSEPGADEWHWSSSGARNDPDKTWIFRTVDDARKVFARLPDRMRDQAQIRRHNSEAWRHDDPYEIVDPVALPVEDDVPPDFCEWSGCRDKHPTCQILFRTRSTYPHYVLSQRFCDTHGGAYERTINPDRYDSVQRLPL